MSFKKNIVPIISLIATILFVYLFTNVIIYLVISLVLSLLGMPIVSRLRKVKIGKFKMPSSVIAFITLSVFMVVIYVVIKTFLPPVISQITFLSKSNLHDVMHNIFIYYPTLKEALLALGSEHQIMTNITEQVHHFFNLQNISSVFNNTISFTGSIIGGVFSVMFITFFFLKDEKMVIKAILLLTPYKYYGETLEIYRSSRKMLSKYFTGLFIDMLLVCFIVTILMWGFGIKNALVIGCLAGVMNVIPYIGPLITLFFSVFLGISGCIEYNQYELITYTTTKIIIILIGTNILDAIFFQPLIFSNTVKAHPLEIFLVVLMAGALGGVIGMVIAIPSYTLLRIISKEYLEHYKFFKKLTEKLPK